jgi:hypothetical protein
VVLPVEVTILPGMRRNNGGLLTILPKPWADNRSNMSRISLQAKDIKER